MAMSRWLLSLGLIISTVPVVPAWTQEAPRLQGWTYRFQQRYLSDQYADKTGVMLRDGKTGSEWVIFQGGPVTIDLDLGGPTEIHGVTVHLSRPNDNYKLRDLTVLARVMGHYQPVGVLPGFWGHTEQRQFALVLKDVQVHTDALRLVFNAPSVLALSEIEVFGQALAQQTVDTYRLPLLADEKPTAREADADGDGRPEVVLENSLLRLVFCPLDGGVCRSFLYKPAGAEFVGPQAAQYGFLRDQLWSPAYQFADRPYTWRTGGDDREAWVELSTTGLGGMMGFTHITKRITLGRGSPQVRVAYRLQNDPSSQTDYTYGFWSHNFLGVVGQTNRYFYPTSAGVGEFTFDPANPPRNADAWFNEPVRGWAACCGANGTGLAVQLSAPHLYCFYNWGGVGVQVPTFEWRYSRLPLKSGEAFETQMIFTPFQGLQRVDGVVDDVLGAIELTPAEGDPAQAVVRLQAALPNSRPVTGQVRLRKLAAGDWEPHGSVTARSDAPGELSVALEGLGPGAYVLNCQVEREGKALDDFERPFTIGGAALAYKREPLEPRVGMGPEEEPSLPRHELTDEIVTPHVKWATPLRGGPIRAIVLCDDLNSREIIELKQRLDLDLTYVKFRTHPWEEEIWQGDRSISNPAQANQRLLDYLNRNRYELLVIAGFDWQNHFTAEVRAAITAQVKAGAGLVCIEPDGFAEGDELAPMMGLSTKRDYNTYGRWQRTDATLSLTAGLPWELFPQTRYMGFSRPPEGEVLATVGETPLIVTNHFGEGRTVALTYDVLTHDWPYRGYSALTPILSYRGGWLRPEYAEMTWNYWEGWYALLCRMAVWAARRDTGAELVSLEPLEAHVFGQPGSLPLQLRASEGNYRVTATFENRFRQPVGDVTLDWTAGEVQPAIPLPSTLGAGVNLASVVVRDAAGNSVAWGQTYVKVAAPAAIKSLAPEKSIVLAQALEPTGQPYERVFRPGEPLRVTATLDLQQPAVPGLRARARLSDTFGRLLWEQSQPLDGSTSEVSFAAEPLELRANGLEWELAVLSDAGQMDVAKTRVLCPAPRDWNHFRLISWSGIYPWRSEYLFDYLGPLVEELVDVAFYGVSEFSNGHVWRNMWHDIDWSYLGLLSYMGPGVADFMDADYARKVAQYNQTKDKQYLVRTPCLEDREWRAKVAEHARKVAQEAAAYGGVHDFCMGDEMSLTHYTAYFDFDWDPRSLAAFREWLKGRYADLSALNQAWETDFATWDEVLPLTLEEARQRANAAPWCEFRDFMNDSLAGTYRMISEALESVDPQARAGLSGTQEPRAGNGMDWWKNSLAFNFYHSYNTGWSNEMRRSFAPYTGVAQSPYYAGYFQQSPAVDYNVLWCLLHDTNALSAWMTPIFFYGDFSYSESGRDTLKLCREMKEGLWDAIRSAKRLHDGIAIHYSHDSINAAQLLAKEEEQKDVRDAWVKLIEDLGLQYTFLATPQIEAGQLTKPDAWGLRYKVLILPESIAISDAEKAAIEDFVRQGGTAIADAFAGLMDGKCRRGPTGVLDDLFGIRRTDAAPDTTADLRCDLPGLADAVLRFPTMENLSPTGATVGAVTTGEARTPALLSRRVGRGQAWYLNMDLRPYDSERTFRSPVEQGLRRVLLSILSSGGVKPVFPVELESGHAPHLETVRYEAGDLMYLGLLPQGGDPEELATVKLGRKWHVYDCRRHTYLGERDTIRAAFGPGDGAVYCLSPRPLAVPKLNCLTPSVPVGGEVKYQAFVGGGSDTARQCLHLEVTDPTGKRHREYARNFIFGVRGQNAGFRLALNDPRGEWRLLLRDLASGKTAEAVFTVR